jgi:hypothetical protein
MTERPPIGLRSRLYSLHLLRIARRCSIVMVGAPDSDDRSLWMGGDLWLPHV